MGTHQTALSTLSGGGGRQAVAAELRRILGHQIAQQRRRAAASSATRAGDPPAQRLVVRFACYGRNQQKIGVDHNRCGARRAPAERQDTRRSRGAPIKISHLLSRGYYKGLVGGGMIFNIGLGRFGMFRGQPRTLPSGDNPQRQPLPGQFICFFLPQ